MRKPFCVALFLIMAALAESTPAFAYFGPGSGISALGSFFSVLAALLLGIIGFIWYPLKRIARALFPGKDSEK